MKKIIICALVLATVFFGYEYFKPKETITPQEQEFQDEIEQNQQDIQAEQYKVDIDSLLKKIKTENANKMIDAISNEIEIIVYEESGTVVDNNKTTGGYQWVRNLTKSKVTVKCDYHCIVSIPVSSIKFTNVDGVVHVSYDKSAIQIKAVEISNIVPIYDKAFLGKKYTNDEILALVQINKDEVYKQINADEARQNQCCINLEQFILNFTTKYNVADIEIN